MRTKQVTSTQVTYFLCESTLRLFTAHSRVNAMNSARVLNTGNRPLHSDGSLCGPIKYLQAAKWPLVSLHNDFRYLLHIRNLVHLPYTESRMNFFLESRLYKIVLSILRHSNVCLSVSMFCSADFILKSIFNFFILLGRYLARFCGVQENVKKTVDVAKNRVLTTRIYASCREHISKYICEKAGFNRYIHKIY